MLSRDGEADDRAGIVAGPRLLLITPGIGDAIMTIRAGPTLDAGIAIPRIFQKRTAPTGSSSRLSAPAPARK
jgi:hypothetical protein